MTDDEVQKVVAGVLANYAPEARFQGADVYSDIDFDGEPIIRVTAHYERLPGARFDVLISAVHAIRSALIEKGDDRFVFLTNDVESERQVAESEDVD